MWKATQFYENCCRVYYFSWELKEEGYHQPGDFWVQYEPPRKHCHEFTLEPAPEGMRDCRRSIEQQAAWSGVEINTMTHTVHAVRYFDAWDREIGYLLKGTGVWTEFEKPKVRAQSYVDKARSSCIV